MVVKHSREYQQTPQPRWCVKDIAIHQHCYAEAVPSIKGYFTESQNHRMVGVGRDLCGSSSPTLLPKQGHLQQAAQDLVQAGLEYL